MPPRRKKKKPSKVIDVDTEETVNETESAVLETPPTETDEIIPPVEDTEAVKPPKKKKKGRKPKKTAVSPDDSVEVCPPQNGNVIPKEEEEAESAPHKSSVRKRPTAADLISEDPSPDPEVSETLDMSSEPSPKVPRRAAAVDFMDESTPVPAKTGKSKITKAAIPKEEVVKAHSSETVSPNEGEDITAEEEEGDGIGGGLEFLGYPNFDAYSNSLLPSGL